MHTYHHRQKQDPRGRRDDLTTLLAFVQHFDIIWEDGWIFLGRKSAEEGFAHVWYKVVKLPVQTKLRFAQDADKVPFTGSRDNVLEYHASFIGLLANLKSPMIGIHS